MDVNQTPSSQVATPQTNTVGETNTDGSKQSVTPQQADASKEAKPADQLYSDQKPESDKQEPAKEGEGEPSKGAEKKEGEKSEEVAYEIKAPEGVTLDPETVTEFTAFAKENKLAPEVAQKVADIGVKHFQKLQKIQEQQLAETIEGWVKETQNHPQLGGANYNKTVEVSQKGIAVIQRPEYGGEIKGLGDALDSGWGNHPAFVELFHRIGKLNSEDTVEHGKPSDVQVSPADAIYGKN